MISQRTAFNILLPSNNNIKVWGF